MLLNCSDLMLHPILGTSDNIDLYEFFHGLNVALPYATKNAPFSGREILPDDKLSKYSTLFQDDDPVHVGHFLYNRIEARDNDGSGYNIISVSSACLSKAAPESLDASCTRHQ